MMTDWTRRRVLITGATGFIGQRLTGRLVTAGAEVWAGVYPAEPPERVAGLPAQAHRLSVDLRDARTVQTAVAESAPEVAFHLAAVGATDPGVDADLALAVNAGGTLHLLEALRGQNVRVGQAFQPVVGQAFQPVAVGQAFQPVAVGQAFQPVAVGQAFQPVARVVLAGTCHEYGARETVEGLDPFSAYAASKVAAWAFGRMYWRVYGLPVVTVRPFQIYGPGQPAHTLVPAALRAALTGEDFPMTPGGQERDFIYVDDVVEGMLAAAAAPGVEGHSLDLGTGQAHTVRHVVEQVWKLAGGTGRILPGALPYRPAEVMRLVADADRTAALIGWRARTGLEEGLCRTIDQF
jgi:nucleoside-diphosphate-sugar epimerase